jgi:hypothetical protein
MVAARSVGTAHNLGVAPLVFQSLWTSKHQHSRGVESNQSGAIEHWMHRLLFQFWCYNVDIKQTYPPMMYVSMRTSHPTDKLTG